MLEFMNNLFIFYLEGGIKFIEVGIVSFGRYLATKLGRWMGVKGKNKNVKRNFRERTAMLLNRRSIMRRKLLLILI